MKVRDRDPTIPEGHPRNAFGLLAVFGGLALLLAVWPLPGHLLFSKSEIVGDAIRLAQGARPGDIVRMVPG